MSYPWVFGSEYENAKYIISIGNTQERIGKDTGLSRSVIG